MRAFQSDDAFEKIREKIVSMEWAPGTRLSSNQIAAALGMSRTPVERALVNLERYGLVEAENGKYSVSTFSLNDIVELYQVKEAVETQNVKILLERGGRFYLLVCCLKTGCDYENDWRSPGVCYGAALPEDLRALGREPLVLTPLKVGMLKNHGYSQLRLSGHDAAVVAWEGGVARFDPPAAPGEPWEIKPLLSVPASDAVLADFDGGGQLELGCISPFHGASLIIYHLDDCGNYVPRWKYPAPEAETAFLHATWAAPLLGRMCWVAGRQPTDRGDLLRPGPGRLCDRSSGQRHRLRQRHGLGRRRGLRLRRRHQPGNRPGGAVPASKFGWPVVKWEKGPEKQPILQEVSL